MKEREEQKHTEAEKQNLALSGKKLKKVNTRGNSKTSQSSQKSLVKERNQSLNNRLASLRESHDSTRNKMHTISNQQLKKNAVDSRLLASDF